MGLFNRLGAYFKSAAVPPGGDIPYSANSYGPSQWPWLLPSTRIDYEVEAGSLTANAIVMATIQWICRTFPEAPLRVMQKHDDNTAEPILLHPLTEKLDQPNPYYNGLLLWQATLASWNLDGNAYWLKMRNDGGGIGELWYEPHSTIRPVWPDDGSEFISGYQVQRRGVWLTPILKRDDVIHFRNGLDPMNPRMGLSPLKSAMREVFTDNEAANFSSSLLRNLGVPGIVVSPAEAGVVIDKPDELKDVITAKFGGDRKGEPLVMAGPTKVEVLSFSPEQMNMETLRNIPEERITALLGIPAVVAGMGTGLDKSTYNNVSEARAAAYENNLLPTQRFLAAQLKSDLLPEFGDPATEFLEFDTSDVEALSENQNDLFERISAAYRGGWLKRGEARDHAAIGLENGPDDDQYVTDLINKAARLTEQENPGTLLPEGVKESTNAPLPPPLPFTAGKSLMAATTTEERMGREQLTQTFEELMAGLDPLTTEEPATNGATSQR